MTTTEGTMKKIATLTTLIAECIAAARREGYTGAHMDLTPADCDWITDQLGRKPTRGEWAEAGYRYVGDAHIAS